MSTKTTTDTPTSMPASPVEIMPPQPGAPQTKLAGVNVTITPENVHLFLGLKVRGIVIWDNGDEGIGVQLPTKPYMQNGEQRRFGVLAGEPEALNALRAYVLDAYWGAQQPTA